MQTAKLKRIMITEMRFSFILLISNKRLIKTNATNIKAPIMCPSPHHPFENPCTQIINSSPNNKGLSWCFNCCKNLFNQLSLLYYQHRNALYFLLVGIIFINFFY